MFNNYINYYIKVVSNNNLVTQNFVLNPLNYSLPTSDRDKQTFFSKACVV